MFHKSTAAWVSEFEVPFYYDLNSENAPATPAAAATDSLIHYYGQGDSNGGVDGHHFSCYAAKNRSFAISGCLVEFEELQKAFIL